MNSWASIPLILRWGGVLDCGVTAEGYSCIYATAGYPESFLYGVLILSMKMSAWCLSEILFHSYFFPFHCSSTNVVLVTATKNLTDSLTVIRSQTFNAAKESHETEPDFRPKVALF
jgi:hypothetical protein